MRDSPAPLSVSGDFGMKEHALKALEFQRVLDVVSGYATSEPGARAIQALRPITEQHLIAARLDQVDEMVTWLIREPDWVPPELPDVAEALERLGLEGSVLSELELVDVLRLLNSAHSARRSMPPPKTQFDRLGELSAGLFKNDELQKRLSGALDEETKSLKDGASAELKRIRKAIRSGRPQLVRHLESIVADLPSRIAVPDASVTLRGGRYCIPIRREGRSEVGGIVHDESASRATLFVEPPSAIELMNELRELELAEDREVQRILAELSDQLRPHTDALKDTFERLVHIDSLFARGTYALQHNCSRPALVARDERGFRIFEGRHPLLLETSKDVVPFDLIMHPGEHVLLITGPNAGGKTVLLKAVGLISAMTEAGLFPPVGPGSELPVYVDIFADIGDEQSIDASLSTFTAHLRNLTTILEGAGNHALCLIDEIGGATDPVEGTALARAVLVELSGRKCLTLATSHLGGLKTLPVEHSAIVSAGLGFDTEALAPLYRLTKGRPGRSYALAMAQRVGFPEKVVAKAKAALSQGEVDTERLLEELEEKEAELAERIAEVGRKEKQLAELEATLEQLSGELEERQREVEAEGHRQAREFLLEARKQVDDALKERKKKAGEARGKLEASLREHTQALRSISRRPEKTPTGDAAPGFDEGEHVWVEVLGRDGRVVETRGADVVVEIGGMKLQLSPKALKRKDAAELPRDKVSTYEGPEPDAQHEVHLRGLTAEEARVELIRALDAAVQAGLPQLRVVHGKGTGVLRESVTDYVRGDARVKSHRLGAPHEGGSGVTVLELE